MIRVFGDGNNSLGKLVTCFICLPTWIGFIVSLINRLYLPEKLITPSMYVMGKSDDLISFLLCIFFDGILASGAVWLVHTMQEYLENNRTSD
jgi:hypothetical protein